jgi:hypothetical protein
MFDGILGMNLQFSVIASRNNAGSLMLEYLPEDEC